MKSYHLAWLAAHPGRTEEWLLDRLADGFDVHHLDGDHSNDDPLNLVLIEHADHFRMHASPPIRYMMKRCPEARENLAAAAYAAKDDNTSWRDVSRMLDFQSTNPSSALRAIVAKYALEHGLPFPKPGANVTRENWRQKLRVSKKMCDLAG